MSAPKVHLSIIGVPASYADSEPGAWIKGSQTRCWSRAAHVRGVNNIADATCAKCLKGLVPESEGSES